MKKYMVSCSLFWILFAWVNSPFGFCQAEVDSAYQHLYEVMDKYHRTFDVYTDQDAGGNNFHSTIIGNYNALKITSGCTTATYLGPQCIRISYKDVAIPKIDWAGVYWLFPDKNWGDYQGHNITGAEKLTFWAKGDKSGEKVEFKMGGVNRAPENDPKKYYQDSCDLLSTGILTLTNDWKEYYIDLVDTEYFSVYLDGNAGSNNRYFPSGWYTGSDNMTFDPNWTQNPHSGTSCIRIEWNGWWTLQGPWNGVMWQYPEGNLGDKPGYNLYGATKLTFWARADIPGLKIKFLVGYSTDSCGEILIDEDGCVELDTIWTQYKINLAGDLSNIAGGFAFIFDDAFYSYQPDYVFYLDDIQFDKPIEKDLFNTIGGFCCAVRKINNPNGCTFYLDNIRYELSQEAQAIRLQKPRFLVSYETTADSSDLFLRNPAYIYDNALAMLAFMARGTEEDWKRAEILANTFNYCQNHDREFKGPLQDNRLRNGYQSGDVIDPVKGYTPLPGVWNEQENERLEDEFSTNSHTGNLGWVAIALLRYYEEGRNKTFLDPAILDSAKSTAIKLGQWIFEKCYDSKIGPPGFFGGYEGRGHVLVTWKSTEHNLDAFIAFSQLAEIDSIDAEKWLQGASLAKTFMDSMWDTSKHYFYAGTLDNGKINRHLYEDVQTWNLFAYLFTNSIKLTDYPYWDAVQLAKDSCYVEHCGFKGFDFNTDRDGIWYEGTAHMALAFNKLGDTIQAESYLQQLRNVQKTANHSNQKGIVAACHDGVSTGLDWKYLNRLHIGATAWYILAEKEYNPYTVVERSVTFPPPIPDNFRLYQNYPNPFNSITTIRYDLNRETNVTIQIFNLCGQLIKKLVDTRQSANYYTVYWDGANAEGRQVASGIYFCGLKTESEIIIRKMVLVR